MKKPDGGKGANVDLPDEIFGIEPNVAVMHQVVTPSSRPSGPVRTTQGAPECAAAAPSPGGRRAPAGPGRDPSARRSGEAVVSRTALTRVTTQKALKMMLAQARCRIAPPGKLIVVDD